MDPIDMLRLLRGGFRFEAVRAEQLSCWLVFKRDTAEMVARIPDTMSFAQVAALLCALDDEMGALYALRDEAKVASYGKEV